MSKRRKIEKFLTSNSEQYAEFLNQLDGGVEFNQKMDNSGKKQELQPKLDNLPEYKHKFMDNGLYGKINGQNPYQELDFEKFSFTVLQELAEDKQLIETIQIIKSLPETKRRKQLRISLFDRLKDINSPYFNPMLYHDVYNRMIEARSTAKQVIKEEQQILTIGFDSFSFIATTEKAEKLQGKVNKELEIGNMTLDTYQSAVKFYNVASFKDLEDQWFTRLSTGTEYDEYKLQVVEALREKDFRQAKKVIVEGKQDTDNDYFKQYMAAINQIEDKVKNESTTQRSLEVS